MRLVCIRATIMLGTAATLLMSPGLAQEHAAAPPRDVNVPGRSVYDATFFAAYSASKAGVANFSKAAAMHCAFERYNIRINSVHPGPTETDMLTGGGKMRAVDIPQVKALISKIPLGRMAQPNEIANVVLFLASELSSYMTASEVFVDAGLTVSMM